MPGRFVIKIQEYTRNADGEKIQYGFPRVMRDENNRVMFFRDRQYAEFLATELNNSPLRNYYVEDSRY